MGAYQPGLKTQKTVLLPKKTVDTTRERLKKSINEDAW
jgi:hypothetical protein